MDMTTGKFDDGRPEILASARGSGYAGADVFYAASGADGLSIFEDSDPYDGGDAETDFPVDSLYSEEGRAGSFGAFSAPDFQQSADIPFLARQKGRARKETLKSVSLDDFEDGTQRWAAGTVIAAVRLFMRNVEKPSASAEVAQWIFGQTQDGASFENCCIVNQARADVLRMRIQYELWRCGKRAPHPFPFLAPLPAFVQNKVLFIVGKAGLDVAKRLWHHPGIEDEELRAELGTREREALCVMADKHIVSPVETEPVRWYLTSINPILEDIDRYGSITRTTYDLSSRKARSTDLSWSSRFGED